MTLLWRIIGAGLLLAAAWEAVRFAKGAGSADSFGLVWLFALGGGLFIGYSRQPPELTVIRDFLLFLGIIAVWGGVGGLIAAYVSMAWSVAWLIGALLVAHFLTDHRRRR